MPGLPPNPSLEQLKKQAKALLKAHRAGEPEARSRLRTSVPQLTSASDAAVRVEKFSLRDAQTVIAREYGFEHWQALEVHVASPPGDDSVAVLGFLEAVCKRDVGALKAALDADLVHLRFDYSLMDLKGEPFRAAVREGRVEGNEMMTALHVMALTRLHGEEDDERARMHRILELLLERGADINAKGRIEGCHYAISMACWEGHITTVKLLLEHGADITGEAGREALFAHGRFETIDLLAQYGAEVPPRAWLLAGEKDHLLQMIDADPSLLNAVDDKGCTLLTTAFEAWSPNYEIINALVERDAAVDVFAAAGLNDVARLEKLYRSADENGYSPLWYAVKGNALEAAELLCSKGAKPEEGSIR